ncbi:putative lipoprotein with Yx(FWY)xxD motif [Thermocatellispora tengchongensis]|uniref:Putative lipoprotein with Yx(FWY)xxD motif n=1 Tax=Thermocatellispora tengchongensis TaxID=1073253 RepID=A0A840PW36_9ACTN|nr:hypothetical protein [Thermocatellispora tengchongensis]MBB5140095.1 putative lipoprotein with Yx(FWY)xxD motif [Thermocatellispora tengchongensis]
MTSRRRRAAALLLGMAALTCGCGAAEAETPRAAAGAHLGEHAGDGHHHAVPHLLNATDSPTVGAIVTDVKGFTLYRYDKDTAIPPATRCTDRCTDKWQPLLADRHMHGHGVHPELVGKVRRPDGSWQATLAGHPLYRYRGDTNPGDINGHGLGGEWYAVTPSGLKAPSAPGDTTN